MDYRWNAEEYARNSSAQWKWALEMIENIHLQSGEQVLDIGCGDGKVTVQLAAQVPSGRVVGIDRSEEMVRYARNAFPTTDFPNLTFRQMDAVDITFMDSFDVVFSNATLHWVPDHRRVLQGICTALRPGGRFFLSMGGRGNASDVVAAFDQVAGRGEWRPFFGDFTFPYAFFGVEDYQSWLPEAGLRTRRVELIPKDMTHPGPAGLAGWMRTTWLPYLERVPAETREVFLGQVVACYLDHNPVDAEGRTHVRMVRLEAAGEKSPGS